MSSPDRILGCILGGAIGDALGGAYEGQTPPIQVRPDAALAISDDTQLTLATCEAIVEAGFVDPERIAATFANWFRQRRLRGLGSSTMKALQELAAGGHWALVGAKGEMAAGNGPATRIAPLAFLLDPTDGEARRTIRDVSRITHHNDEAYCGALAVAVAIRMASTGAWAGGRGLLLQVVPQLPDCAVRERLLALSSQLDQVQLTNVAREFGSSGYVVESVPLALMAAERLDETGLQRLIENVIALGGDTDSIASITGQICGARTGAACLPKETLDRLPESDQIAQIGLRFAEYVRDCGNVGH